MMYSRHIILFFLIGVIVSCRSITPEQQFRQYVEDPKNHLTQVVNTGDISVTSRFLPATYRKLSQQSDEVLTEEKLYYFDVKIDRKSLEKLTKEKIEYLVFSIQNDFSISTADGKIVMPLICQKVENGITGNFEYLLAFDSNDIEGKAGFTLSYSDKTFGIGDIVFDYKSVDIKNIPVLKDLTKL